MDLAALHPPLGLLITAGTLEMRLLRDDDLPAYAELLRRPIFADPTADSVFPWYRREEDERVRGALGYQWAQRAAIAPESWSLPFGAFVDGELVGSQEVSATQFAQRRVVGSGSWLALEVQGRGLGRLMRQAMLVMAFDHLGAVRAESAAVLGNHASAAVSHRCGYVDDGTTISVEGDRTVTMQRFLVTPETVVRPDVSVEVTGLTDDLRAMLGARPRHAPQRVASAR